VGGDTIEPKSVEEGYESVEEGRPGLCMFSRIRKVVEVGSYGSLNPSIGVGLANKDLNYSER
jgi:hypothetical protein